MDLLADEHVKPEWIRALRDDGHDVLRVVDALEQSTPDDVVLETAAERERVLLTADTSDFGDPPLDGHAGIVLVSSVHRSGDEIRRAVRSIERAVPDTTDSIFYVSSWLE